MHKINKYIWRDNILYFGRIASAYGRLSRPAKNGLENRFLSTGSIFPNEAIVSKRPSLLLVF